MVKKTKNTDEIEEKIETEDRSKKDLEIEKLKEDLREQTEIYKRALADYQNLEKRIRDDKINWIQNANKDLIYRLLTVLDTLTLAAKHTKDEGIKMTLLQFMQVLENEGVSKIKTDGQTFDPKTMEAIGTETGKENIVLEEVRSGIMLNGKILRPAQVKVGKENN